MHGNKMLQHDNLQLMDPESDEAVCEQWSATLRVYHDTSCELESELQARHRLGLSEFEVLQVLAGRGGDAERGVLMKDLEARMHLSQSALSRTVTRLEKAGLVTRASCEVDRRASVLMLTAAGRERWQEARPTHSAVLKRHFT
ncbi:MAG TPA: MarR family transcriptional regulator [Glycomyces sp.]|nr:MarR family transcriptional regulator [Glycomyces sp.]